MEKLFLPINIGALELTHRVVMPGVVDYRRAPDADPEDCVRRAAPGGLVVTPPVPVSPGAARAPFPRGFDDAETSGAWAGAVRAAQSRNVRIVARLWHPGTGEDAPASLDGAAIDAVIDDYRRAAEQARGLGFDGVELDAADGALPDQFLQDGTNRRGDRYGGSIQNRLNVLCEIVEALVGVWTAERVGVRLSPFGAFRSMSDSDPVALFTAALSTLGGQEVSFVHLVRTAADGAPLGHLPYDEPGCAARIRAAFPSAIIASGAFTRAGAVDLVRSRWADAIGVESGTLDSEGC